MVIEIKSDELFINPLQPKKKSFIGLDIGIDGIPIDLVKIALSGKVIHGNTPANHSTLIADSFASKLIAGESGLNDVDLAYARNNYVQAFTTLDSVFDTQSTVFLSSQIMKDVEYTRIFEEVQSAVTKRNMTNRLSHIATEHGTNCDDRLKYGLHELAHMSYFLEIDHLTKIGPQSERRYDEIYQTILPNMQFMYFFPTHSISQGKNALAPHRIDGIHSLSKDRILLTDDPQTVEEKLDISSLEAIQYFAILGSVAGRLRGRSCYTKTELESLDILSIREIAKEYLVDNIIAPFRHGKNMPVYRKTDARVIYDDNIEKVQSLFKDYIPNLNDIVRPRIDSITQRLFALLEERQKYNSELGHQICDSSTLHTNSMSKSLPNIYRNLLEILPRNDSGNRAPIGLELQLMDLLQERICIGFNVALAKLGLNKSVYDGQRELQVLKNTEDIGTQYGFSPNQSRGVMQYVIDKTKELQEIVISRYCLDFKDGLR
jgi:chorismate mutase